MMFFNGLKLTRLALGLSFFLVLFSFSQTVSASTIAGTVFDNYKNALPDVDIELLDQYYRQINRTRTDANGRYQFDGLSDGNYTVKAMPFRYDLIDQSNYVEIATLSVVSQSSISPRNGKQGNAYIVQDFYLQPKKGGLNELGVIFAQEIPKDVQKTYEKAVKDIADKRPDEGIGGLKKAVEGFPTYYNALHRLGKELFMRKSYGEAAYFLLKAAEVNPKSATSFYYAGLALNKIGKDYNKSAIKALTLAHTLAPASEQVCYMLGKVEREEGNFTNAEKYLLQAKKLKANVAEIHIELAQLYGNDLKKFKEAADELEMYLKASNIEGDSAKDIKKKVADLREKAKAQTN